jgi:hypothetical protein
MLLFKTMFDQMGAVDEFMFGFAFIKNEWLDLPKLVWKHIETVMPFY